MSYSAPEKFEHGTVTGKANLNFAVVMFPE